MKKVKDSSAEYHGQNRLSASYLKLLKQCPAKMAWAMMHASKPTPEQVFGTYFHSLVLEPERETQDFYVAQYKGNTKDGKAERKEAEAKGQILITEEDRNLAYAMRDNLENNEVWRAISGGRGETEMSYYWDATIAGKQIACKARMDGTFWLVDTPYVIDLKTCKDSSPDAIQKAIATYSMHLQAAWYRNAFFLDTGSVPEFIFFFCEKNPPYIVTPVQLHADAIAKAMCEIDSLLFKFVECLDQGWTETYVPPTDVLTLDLPSWYRPYGENDYVAS